MNRLDKRIKRVRTQRYKLLKKLFKARDMASGYLDKPIRISQLINNSLILNEVDYAFTGDLAYFIVKKENLIRGIRPPKPPSRPVTVKK